MFVTADDFDLLPFNIPNIDAVANSFNDFIEQEEVKILRKILGSEFYNVFNTELSKPEIDIPDRFKKLRDGEDYIYSNFTYTWHGLKAMLKPYIYFEWLRATCDNHSGNGIVVSNVENANVIPPAQRMVDGWNEFVEHCNNGVGIRPQANSLYGYMIAKNMDFNGDISSGQFLQYWYSNFKCQRAINIFNL